MGFWFVVGELAVTAGLYLLNKYMRGAPPPPKPLTKDNLTLPRTEEGSAVPLVFGRCRVDSPILIYASDTYTRTNDNSNNGAAYITYAVDLLFVVGIPMGAGVTNGNSLAGPKLHNVWAGDTLWPSAGSLPHAGTSLYRAKMVFRPGFFGGPGVGGGVMGAYQFFGGYTDQDFFNPPSPIGDALVRSGHDAASVPGFRKQMCVSFTDLPRDSSSPYWGQTELDGEGGSSAPHPRPGFGFYLGESANVPGFAFEVSSYGDKVFAMTQPGFDFGGDADPVEVIYDLLTNKWAKLGMDPSKIDMVSFLAASQTLKAEGHGYSATISREKNGAEAIVDILKQIDAALYEEPTTGQLVLKLIRADYDPNTIPAFDETNIVEVVEYGIGAFKNTINEVRVHFTDRTDNYKPGVATAQSLANATANESRRRIQDVEYPGCTSAALAGKLAARDLNVYSQPLLKIQLIVNRDGHTLRPGSVFKVTYAEYNISGAVFRCQDVDQGQLFAGTVRINAVQDAFASTYVGQGQSTNAQPPPAPHPIADRFVTEAPRWLAKEAGDSGLVADPTVPHLIAVPKASANATQFLLKDRELDSSGQHPLHNDYLVDVPQTDFPMEFAVAVAYPRYATPHDQVVGLVVGTPSTALATALATIDDFDATDDQIANDGKNLVMLLADDGTHEFIAFESVTSLGGGQYRLEGVWRGLMDTPPQNWAVGARGIFVGAHLVGRRGWSTLKSVQLQILPRSQFVTGSGGDPEDTFAIGVRGRCLLPLPPSYVRISGDAVYGTIGQPFQYRKFTQVNLLEEGADVYALKRDLESQTLKRGDASNDSLSNTSTTYGVLAKDADGESLFTTSDIQSSDLVGGFTAGWKVDGFGDILVGLDTIHTLPSSKGGFAHGGFLHSLSLAALDVRAPSWRNLLANARFNYATTGAITGGDGWWTTISGTHGVLSDNFSLSRLASGKDSYYLWPGAGNPMTVQQATPVAAWKPRGLTAVLVAYAHNSTMPDANDTGQLTLEANAVISSNVATAAPTTNWTRFQHSMTLPAGTSEVLARLTSAEVAGGGITDPQVGWTEAELRVGQFQINVLANYSFETGTTASWTVASGSFAVEATIASPSANYLRATAIGSSIYQEYALPAGWEVGSEAFVTCFRAQTADPAPGEVRIEAMDALSNVLASGTTSVENISFNGVTTTQNVWVRRTAFVQIPEGATKIRVTFNGSTGACLDEAATWISKELRPRYQLPLDFSAPTVQPMPNTWQAYALAYPDNPQPSVVLGGTDFNGYELEWSDQVARASTKLYGQFGGGVTSVDAYQFTRGSGVIAPHIAAIHRARTTLGAFASSQSFTVRVQFRLDELTFGGACGLVGRRDLSAGWGLRIDASGHIVAEMEGAGGTVTATTTGLGVVDGAYHEGWLVYDAAAQTLTAYDERGVPATVSTAAMGEIARIADTCHMRVGRDRDASDVLPGQIARVIIWPVALTPAQVATHLTYAKDPTGKITTYTRGGPAIVPMAPNADGATACVMSADQVAIAYRDTLTVDGGSGYGLAVGRESSNQITSFDFHDTSKWQSDGAGILFHDTVDMTGRPRGVLVSTAAAGGIQALGLTVPPTPGTFSVIFWARAFLGLFNLDIEIDDSAGGIKDSQSVALTTEWQRFEVALDWDGSAGGARLRFLTASGVFALGGVMFAALRTTGAGYNLPAIFSATAGGTHPDYNATVVTSLPVQLNREGEVVAEGTSTFSIPAVPAAGSIVTVTNGVDNKHRRELQILAAGGGLRFAHYDGAGAAVNSDVAYSGANQVARVWKMRGRWSALGLLDVTPGRFAQIAYTDSSTPVAVEGGAGRTAIWTHDATPLTKIVIGHGTIAPDDVVLRRVTVQAREEKFD